MATQNQLAVNRERALQINKAITSASSAYSAYPNGSVGLYVRYKGSSSLAAVAVAAGGDLAFTADEIDGRTTADTSIGLPTANGTIDVSDALANTMAKIRDHINSLSDWECFLGDVLPSWSSVNTFAALTAANSQTGTGTGGRGVQTASGKGEQAALVARDQLCPGVGVAGADLLDQEFIDGVRHG